MGQYFLSVNLDKQEFVSPTDYNSGLKLTEHSWLYNPMVGAIVLALTPFGPWYRDRIVWAGDYMDEGLFLKGIKGRTRKDRTLYECCRDDDDDRSPCISRIRPVLPDGPVPELIVSHDAKEFVWLLDLPEEDPADPGWHLHPLPLLTCSGNGRGGGDFRGDNRYTGAWAGHHISAEYLIPPGYKEIRPAFTER